MLKNNRGISLVEILAGLALVSMVTILAISIQLIGQKQTGRQQENIANQSRANLAMNIITSEIRKATTIKINEDAIEFFHEDTEKYFYTHEDKILYKNSQRIFPDLAISLDVEENNKILISVKNKISSDEKPETLSTTIFLRN